MAVLSEWMLPVAPKLRKTGSVHVTLPKMNENGGGTVAGSRSFALFQEAIAFLVSWLGPQGCHRFSGSWPHWKGGASLNLLSQRASFHLQI